MEPGAISDLMIENIYQQVLNAGKDNAPTFIYDSSNEYIEWKVEVGDPEWYEVNKRDDVNIKDGFVLWQIL